MVLNTTYYFICRLEHSQLWLDALHDRTVIRAVFKGGGVRDQPPSPEMFKKKFNKYCICLYSKVVYENEKQAPTGEIAATRYVSSEPQKMRLRPGLHPGPRWGSLQCSPNPLAGNGGGPREGGGKRRGVVGREGLSPERKSWLRP